MNDHSCRVDYYSYTIKGEIDYADQRQIWHTILSQSCPKYLVRYQSEWDWQVPKRMNGYTFGFNIDKAIFVWFNGRDIHIEITGDGCTKLYQTSELLAIIAQTKDAATRLDVAHDIICTVSPLEFVALSSTKTSASGYQNSDTGETCYVGSRKSDRACKVYRYKNPHPRADRLRIEYTYKKQDAVIACNKLISSNEAIMAFSSGERYGWQHECFKTLQSPDLIEIKAHRKDRNTAKTVIWYKTQVLPAIKKMIKSGDYTLNDILSDMKGLIDDVQ